MKVLVTGATGFIGNHVINELLRMKIEVIATSIDDIKKSKNASWFKKVKYIPYDLNKTHDNFFKFFDEPDLMIHLSWQGLPNYSELFHIEENLFSNYLFIKNMIKNGLKDLSVIGTCLEYGLQDGCLQEDIPTQPTTSYGLAKDTLRKFLEQLQQKYSFSFKWIRLFYIYGDGQNPNSLLPQLDNALNKGDEKFNMSGGAQLRDYLSIESVAEYITRISLQNEVLGIINCCSGTPISIKELIENHIKKSGKSIKLNLGFYPYTNYEPMKFWGDDTKLKYIMKSKHF